MAAHEKSDRRAQKRFRALRTAFLVFFLLLSTVLGILHQFPPVIRPVGVDALDPFGAIESALSVLVSGKLLQYIAWSSFILLLATLIAALVFRRVFCGKICAFGALQELFGRLGKLIFRKRFTVPAALDKPARYLKYVMLVFIVVMSFATASLFIRPYDPWAAYHHLLSPELMSGFLVGLILLAVSLAGSLLYDRFFCKYLCPMGGFLGLLSPAGWFRIKRNNETCTHCLACNKACPVNISVESVTQVKNAECINCNLCVASCPVKDTLVIEGPRAGRVSPHAVLWITAAIFVATLGITTATGGFEWTVKSVEQASHEAGKFDPTAISGTDTFKKVSELSGVSKAEFLAKFKISEQDFEGPIREASHREGSGFDTAAVRDFVAEKMKGK
jgi:polyferredoxin